MGGIVLQIHRNIAVLTSKGWIVGIRIEYCGLHDFVDISITALFATKEMIFFPLSRPSGELQCSLKKEGNGTSSNSITLL
jgi:hypothetical protein